MADFYTCMEDKYRIKQCIVKGRVSSIYLCQLRNTRGDPTVVLKKSIRKERMYNEIEYYKKLNGAKRVLQVFDVCKCIGSYRSLVLELCVCDLAHYLGCPVGVIFHFEKVNLAMQLLEGISEIHARNIVHKDLKPENLFLTFDGILKIGDLESACEDKTSTGRTTIRTLGYTPLEMILGLQSIEKSVDLWAAGCILFEIFTGALLFKDMTIMNELLLTTQLFGLPSGPFYESLPGFRGYHDAYKKFSKGNHFPKHLKDSMGPNTKYEQQVVESLLQLEPSARTPASQLLISSPIFKTYPLPTTTEMTDGVKRFMKVTKSERSPPNFPPEICWPVQNGAKNDSHSSGPN